MPVLFANPEDRFSHVSAHMIVPAHATIAEQRPACDPFLAAEKLCFMCAMH